MHIPSLLPFLPLLPLSHATPPPSPQTIHQYPHPTWIENLHSTRTGHLLISILGRADLELVEPSTGLSTHLHTFPQNSALFGLADLDKNTYAVAVGNYTLDRVIDPHSYSIHALTLPSGKISKIADLPDAQLLNGMASLDSHVLLIADSKRGVVWKVDSRTKRVEVAIEHQSMKSVEGDGLGIGINGLKRWGRFLYYTNSAQGTLMRVRVNSAGHAVGGFEVIAGGLKVPDDFDVLGDGSVILALPVENSVVRVDLKGVVTTVLGGVGETVLAGATSVSLGRGRESGKVFVGTNGGLSGPVNGTFEEGGKVVGWRL